MKRNFVQCTMLLSLSGALLAACSGGAQPEAGSPLKGAAEQKQPPAQAVKPELKYLGSFASGFDPNTDPAAKLVEEVTGYKVQYSMLPAEQANEKLNLEMASGAYYDIIAVNRQQFLGLVNQNLVIPMDELLASHGQNILKSIDEKAFGAATVKGKKYGIPTVVNHEYISWGMAVRQEVLDKLGLKVPTTADEFYTVLKTVKDKTGLIPLVSDSPFIETIASAFGLSTDWKDAGGNLVPLIKQEGMLPYLEFMHKLYAEGLIDPDLPVSKLDNAREKFVSGKAVFMRYGWTNRLPELVVPEIEKAGGQLTVVSPLKDKNGKSEIKVDRGAGKFSVVPRASKHAADAVKFMDIKLEENNHKYIGIGREGIEHKVENGKYYPIQPKFNELRSNAYWYPDGVDTVKWPEYWLARNMKNEYNHKIFMRMMEDKPAAGVFDPTAYAPPMDGSVKYTSSLDQMRKDYFVKIVAGAESLVNHGKFVANWENAGGKEVEKELNDWYRTAKK